MHTFMHADLGERGMHASMCMPACRPTCRPSDLPACLHACMRTHQDLEAKGRA